MPRALRSQPVSAPAADPEPFLHKILLVGESNTGKTSLALRWVHNVFRPQTKATIGVDFHLKSVPINDSTNVIVQLWDVSGQERFSQMTRVFYGGAVGAVVTFDVTQNDTFEAVAAWKDDIDKKCFLADGRNIPVMLMGTKSDLAANPVRSDEEMNDFCVKHGFAGWHTTSSKTGANVNDAFVELIGATAKNDREIQAAGVATTAAKPEPVRRAPSRHSAMTIQTIPPAPGSRPIAANPRSPSPPADFNFVLASPAPTGAAVHHHPPAVAGHKGATTVHLHNQATETKKKNRKCFGIF